LKKLFIIVLFVGIFSLGSSAYGDGRYDDSAYNAAKEDVVNFLIGQQNPTSGMVDSYEDDNSSVGWLYDNALALIVLTDAGKKGNAAARQAAQALAAAFVTAQQDNAWWWEGYDTANGAPYTDTSRGSGVQAWMAYALSFYGFNNGDLEAIRAAENYAGYCIDNFRDSSSGKFDYWGGYDSSGNLFNFKSFEQSVDIWWMFKILGDSYSHENRTMTEYAKLLWQELSDIDNGYWNISENRWNASLDANGLPYTLIAEDCQSWGAILAYINHDQNKAHSSLNFSHSAGSGLITTISNFATDLHGTITVKGFENDSPSGLANIWNGGTAHESIALGYLNYSPSPGVDSRYWLDYLMDVQNLSTVSGNSNRAWFHSIIDDPDKGHYSRLHGLHIGESSWAYFVLSNYLSGEQFLPYERTWILRLGAPFYKKEQDHYSASASCKMTLDYIKENNVLTQAELHNYGYNHNNPANIDIPDMDAQGACAAMNYYKPVKYNFAIRSMATINESLRDACYWMDYEVPGVNRPNTPVIFPSYGGYGNWMVARGASASIDPSEANKFTINGLWVNDPSVSGIGAKSYKTAAELEATYLLPLATSDPWRGKYVMIAEPPATLSSAEVIIPEAAVTDANNTLICAIKANEKNKVEEPVFGEKMLLSAGLVLDNVQMQGMDFSSWTNIIDPSLLRDPEFMAAFEDTIARDPVYVKRTDKDNSDYYLVPFEKMAGDQKLTSVVLIIDASQGYFKEASWVSQPAEYLPAAEEGVEFTWDPKDLPSPYYPHAVIHKLKATPKNVSDGKPATEIGFGVVSGRAMYVTPSAYIEIAYNNNEINWALEIYTNNAAWTGSKESDRGGLIGQINTNMRVPMLWQVHNNAQASHPALSQSEVDDGNWTWLKDKGDPDWASSSDYRCVLAGNADHTWLKGYPGADGPTGSISPVAFYLGGKFEGNPADSYSTTIILDMYHW